MDWLGEEHVVFDEDVPQEVVELIHVVVLDQDPEIPFEGLRVRQHIALHIILLNLRELLRVAIR